MDADKTIKTRTCTGRLRRHADKKQKLLTVFYRVLPVAGRVGRRSPCLNITRSTATGRQNRAFTLIEILVAFLILSVGILGILVLFPVGILASARSSNISRSAVIARSAVDMLTNGGLGNAALTATTKTPDESGPWYIPEQVSGADPTGVLDDDGLIITGTPVDIDGDGTDDVILCDEATAFSWNATVSNAVDASGSEIQGLYAVQIRVFRNFSVTAGSGTVTFTEGYRTVDGTGTSWLTGREILAGYYIKSDAANTDGLWYEVSAINSDTELSLARPYEGATLSGGDYSITKSLIAVYDTFVAAR